MKGKIYGMDIEADRVNPIVIVSKAWGFLGKYATIAIAKDQIGKVTIKTDHPHQIGHGHVPKDAEIFQWAADRSFDEGQWIKVEL